MLIIRIFHSLSRDISLIVMRFTYRFPDCFLVADEFLSNSPVHESVYQWIPNCDAVREPPSGYCEPASMSDVEGPDSRVGHPAKNIG